MKPHRRFWGILGSILFYLILGVLICLSLVIRRLTDWFDARFGVRFEEIIYTATSPLKGADTSFLNEAIRLAVLWVMLGLAILAVLILFERFFFGPLQAAIRGTLGQIRIRIPAEWFYRLALTFFCFLMLWWAGRYADSRIELTDYLKRRTQATQIYEDRYVDPKTAGITGESPKNVIWIYVESLETTYASTDVGGAQPEDNYMPYMTEYAGTYTAFSDKEAGKLGGFHCTTGTGWTVAALFATETGVPFTFPVEDNSMGERESFAGGITAFGDVLAQQGYHQEFICGSDADFAGRRQFYETHGGYDIFDYYTAMETGYIPQDYFVWWGFEDLYLFQIAKEEVLKLAAEDTPFNLTLLTVDTHHVYGYHCALCEDTFDAYTGNVVACTDRQLHDFVEWCKEQDFYKDTVIVITGDHPRMDTELVDGVDYYDRTVYTCLIGEGLTRDQQNESVLDNRTFTPMDLLPTVLDAMGFEIPDGRLGLGVDLFLGTPTLAEELGFENLDAELSKYSEYYLDNFS